MHGMTLKNFVQTMTNYAEIEFSYKGVQYDFQKEKSATAGKIKISVWQSGANSPCYCVKVENNFSAFKKLPKISLTPKFYSTVNLSPKPKNLLTWNFLLKLS